MEELQKAPDFGKESEKNTKNPLLLFGQGPVIDKAAREKPVGISGNEDINFWSKNLATAAWFLYKTGQTDQIIIMGGRTGGEQYKTEAELIGAELAKLGVGKEIIIEEKESTDTLTNLVNMLNIMDARDRKQTGLRKYQVLGAPSHLARIKILMRIFNIQYSNVFNSEEIIKYIARNGGNVSDWVDYHIPTDSSKWNTTILDEVDARNSLKDNNYYQKQKGTEKRSAWHRMVHDDLWTRELLERPESWLARVAEIENPLRRSMILETVERLFPSVLKERFGIDTSKDSSEQIREKLLKIKKSPLTPEEIQEWIKENETIGWPKGVEQRLLTLVDEK